MNVGVVFGNASPAVGGGFTFGEELGERLLEHAPASQHRFVVLTWDPNLGSMSPQGPVRFVTLPSSRRNGTSVRGFTQRLFSKARRISTRLWTKSQQGSHPGTRDPVLEELRRRKVDLLWIIDPWSLRSNDSFFELPYILTVWDLQHRLQPFFPEVSADGLWKYREELFSTSLRRAAYVLTGTEAGKTEIERFYQVPAERIRTLPHPTPRFALEPGPSDLAAVLTKYGIGRPYVFYPAQFWPHKNHVGLLKALHVLKQKQRLDLSVVFVGSDFGNLEYVKGMARELGLSERSYFLGFVSREELVALYRGAFCMAYVSYFGPENLPPLEAFALGCPVIASAVPGSSEQLGDAALLVDPQDHNAIAEGIKRLQDQPAMRNLLVERGLTRARRFTGTDFIKRIFELLDEFGAVRCCWPNDGCRPIS